MNPHQKNKVDVKSLSPEELRIFRLYGKLPSRSDHFAKHLNDRKYFDSGDYAMSKAGKGDGVDAGAVGSQHPVPENIPHLSSPANGGGPNGGKHAHHHASSAASPVKESSFLHRETSADGDATPPPQTTRSGEEAEGKTSTDAVAAAADGIPIRT